MINQRFGKWTVIEKVNGYEKNNRFICKCDCGNNSIILGFTLRNGASTQCIDCYNNRSHGQSKTSTYNIWSGLFTRCYNKNHVTYKHYGAKGITVCDAWRSYENFFKDMGERPNKYQIDRIDNTKGYSKENCRWISKLDNTKRQNNRLIDVTGMKFGKWTVIDRDITKLDRDQAYWNCICDCGYRASVVGSMMRRGNTRHCYKCKNKAHTGWPSRLENRKEN